MRSRALLVIVLAPLLMFWAPVRARIIGLRPRYIYDRKTAPQYLGTVQLQVYVIRPSGKDEVIDGPFNTELRSQLKVSDAQAGGWGEVEVSYDSLQIESPGSALAVVNKDGENLAYWNTAFRMNSRGEIESLDHVQKKEKAHWQYVESQRSLMRAFMNDNPNLTAEGLVDLLNISDTKQNKATAMMLEEDILAVTRNSPSAVPRVPNMNLGDVYTVSSRPFFKFPENRIKPGTVLTQDWYDQLHCRLFRLKVRLPLDFHFNSVGSASGSLNLRWDTPVVAEVADIPSELQPYFQTLQPAGVYSGKCSINGSDGFLQQWEGNYSFQLNMTPSQLRALLPLLKLPHEPIVPDDAVGLEVSAVQKLNRL